METQAMKLGERYEVLEEVGPKGVLFFYRGLDTSMSREVAIVRAAAERRDGYEYMPDHLIEDAMALASIQHPYFGEVFDFGKDDGGAYVVTELIPGVNLEHTVEREPLVYEDFVEFVKQTLDAMVAAHGAGISRVMLEPWNIMLARQTGERFRIKVQGFGRVPRGGSRSGVMLTAGEGGEEIESEEGRYEFLSLGRMYYQVLVGWRPMEDVGASTIAGSRPLNELPSCCELRRDVPEAVCDWIMWLMREADEVPGMTATGVQDLFYEVIGESREESGLSQVVVSEEEEVAATLMNGDTMLIPTREMESIILSEMRRGGKVNGGGVVLSPEDEVNEWPEPVIEEVEGEGVGEAFMLGMEYEAEAEAEGGTEAEAGTGMGTEAEVDWVGEEVGMNRAGRRRIAEAREVGGEVLMEETGARVSWQKVVAAVSLVILLAAVILLAGRGMQSLDSADRAVEAALAKFERGLRARMEVGVDPSVASSTPSTSTASTALTASVGEAGLVPAAGVAEEVETETSGGETAREAVSDEDAGREVEAAQPLAEMETMLREGKAAVESGDDLRGFRHFLAAADKFPDSERAREALAAHVRSIEDRAPETIEFFEPQLRESAERGVAAAMRILGRRMFALGQWEAAHEWFRRGALEEDVKSTTLLGLLMLEGKGTQKDLAAAAQCFEKSADRGDQHGAYLIGECYVMGRGVAKDPAKGMGYLETAAGMGDLRAMDLLGVCYARGLGTETDLEKAVSFFRAAVEKGYTGALANLGVLYMNGQGVAQDAEKAVEYFKRGAEARHAHCMYLYGRCLEEGLGTAKNVEGGANWLRRAVAAGNSEAREWLAERAGGLSE